MVIEKLTNLKTILLFWDIIRRIYRYISIKILCYMYTLIYTYVNIVLLYARKFLLLFDRPYDNMVITLRRKEGLLPSTPLLSYYAKTKYFTAYHTTLSIMNMISDNIRRET